MSADEFNPTLLDAMRARRDAKRGRSAASIRRRRAYDREYQRRYRRLCLRCRARINTRIEGGLTCRGCRAALTEWTNDRTATTTKTESPTP